MKTSSFGLIVLALVVALTWLSLSASNSEAERFDVALADIDRFGLVQAALHRDVLSARAGMLRNYDRLVVNGGVLDDTLARLRGLMSNDPAPRPALAQLTESLAQQEELVEQFKSTNALLQNSLAYFALASGRLHEFKEDLALTAAASALVGATLRLTLDTSAPSVGEVERRLDMFAQQPKDGDAQRLSDALLAHGRLLHDLLPTADGLLKSLYAVPQEGNLENLRNVVLREQAASRALARQSRLLLYVAALLLMVLLIVVGVQLRARVRALRRRAAAERLIAAIGMRLVNARGTDIDGLVEGAIVDLAGFAAADRAYLLFEGLPERGFAWCRQGVTFPPTWPDAAWRLIDCQAGAEGITRVPDTRRLPRGARRDGLVAAGLRGWACALRTTTGGSRALLGFDTVDHTLVGDFSLAGVALDTLANALNRRSLEQERARLQARLEQGRHLATVGTLASGIAHNFNNMIGAILGYAELARETETCGAGAATAIDDIRRAGERARELVEQILVFAQRRGQEHAPIAVESLVTEAVSLLRAALPSAVDVTVSAIPGGAAVSGIASHLQQVLLNLGSNAAQAMDSHGRIRIDVALVELAGSRMFSSGTLPAGEYVRIALSDTGRGIDPAVRPRIFEPFFTTRATGTGLGLATSLDTVLEHGGAIDVQSTVGVGSCFEVWLPRVPLPGHPGAVDDGVPLGHGETILLVEGDAAQLLRAEELIAALGYEPVGFTQAAQALAAYRAAPGRFDALVIGYLATSAASLELAGAVRRIAAGLPILVAVASVEATEAEALLQAGVSDVVSWPIKAPVLAATLQSWLRRAAAGAGDHPLSRRGRSHQLERS